MNWNQQCEEQKPPTPEQVRQAFRVMFGEKIVPLSDSEISENRPFETSPDINFSELENRCPTLSLQQIKPVGNRWETSSSPSEPERSPYEPKRGPRGFLNTLPEATQQKILDLLEDHARPGVAETLSKPVPEGLGFRVSVRMLERFENRHKIMEHRAEIADLAEAAREVANDPHTTDADLTNAALRIVRASILEYASDIQNFDSLERLNNALHKLRRDDIADRRQSYLERAKSRAVTQASELACQPNPTNGPEQTDRRRVFVERAKTKSACEKSEPSIKSQV